MPAQVYALDKTEVGSESDGVEGTLSISGKSAKILIDPSSTHSFSRPMFIRDLGLKLKILSYVVEVSTPTGVRAFDTDKIYRNCEVMICNKKFLVDLIFLPINGYDVILGMDWLS